MYMVPTEQHKKCKKITNNQIKIYSSCMFGVFFVQKIQNKKKSQK